MVDQGLFELGVDTGNALAQHGSSRDTGASSTDVQAMNNRSATGLAERATVNADFEASNTANMTEECVNSGMEKAQQKVFQTSGAI